MKFGSLDISQLLVGSQQVQKIYQGANTIYELVSALPDLPIGLIAHYPLYSDTLDTTGNYNGISTGTISYSGTDVLFDGTSEYIDTGWTPDGTISEYSFSLWAKINNDGRSNIGVMMNINSGCSSSYSRGGIHIYQPAVGNAYFYLSYGGYWYNDNTIPANSVLDGNYHHIVWTLNGNVHSIYVDGNLVGSITATGINSSAPLAGTETFKIGRMGLCSWFFPGNMHDVRIYDHELNLTEVQSLYNSGT